MEAAREVRHAARNSLGAIEPTGLARMLDDILVDASMVPGVVTVLTAERLGGPEKREAALDRAVGVQLSYEGLRLTRELIRDEERYDVPDPTEGYLALVAGEVLVSRGFGELADTAVSNQAIEIVQRFSKNQTHEYYGPPEAGPHGRSLERDVVALGVAAGATTVRETVPGYLTEYGEQLATEVDREPLPPATEVAVPIRTGLDAAVGGDDILASTD